MKLRDLVVTVILGVISGWALSYFIIVPLIERFS